MIVCGSKGQAISELGEWFSGLTALEWYYFILVLILSVAMAIISHVLIRKCTKRNINEKFDGTEIIFPPLSWWTIPTCVFMMSLGLLIIGYGLIDDGIPFIIMDAYFVITILGVTALPRYAPCEIIKYNGVYYISKSWFGKNFSEVNSDNTELKYYDIGIRIYHNGNLYGMFGYPSGKMFKSLNANLVDFFEFVCNQNK